MSRLRLTVGTMLLCWSGLSHADSTQFRVVKSEAIGRQGLEVELAVTQGFSNVPIDVWVNSKLPAHRLWVERGDKGPAVETGINLGKLSGIAAEQTVMRSFKLDLKDLRKRLGVERGDTLYFSIKLPPSCYGGHEWGVNGGGAQQTSCVIPAAGKAPKARGSRSPRSLTINNASAAQLATLKGIGTVLAKRIVSDRVAHGRFRSTSNLITRVRGIGPHLARRLSSPFKVSGRSTSRRR